MRKLYDLETKEVSLVPKGANKKKFLIYKSRKGKNEMAKKDEILKLLDSADPKIMTAVETVVKTMTKKKVKKDGGDLPPKKDSAVYKEPGEEKAPGLSDRAQAALKASARILAPHKDELDRGHLDAIGKEIGMEDGHEHGAAHNEGGHMGDMKDMDEMAKAVAYPEAVEDEHHAEALDFAKKKAMKKMQKAYKKHLEKLGYRKYPDEQPKVASAEVDKDLDEDDEEEVGEKMAKSSVSKGLKGADLSTFTKEQRAQMEPIFKAHQEVVQKNEELEKKLYARETAEKNREFVAKADGWKNLGLTKEDVVETLKDADKLGSKAYERVCKQFDALNEQSRSSEVFKEYGTSASGATDAEARLDALVKQVVAKSENLDYAEAYDKVLESKEGRKLYAEIKNARKGGA